MTRRDRILELAKRRDRNRTVLKKLVAGAVIRSPHCDYLVEHIELRTDSDDDVVHVQQASGSRLRRVKITRRRLLDEYGDLEVRL